MSAPTLPRLLCLAGLSGAGKDTVAGLFVREFGYVRVAVADPLKAAVMQVFGLGATDLWGPDRDRRHPALGTTPRELYQRFGDDCRDLDPQVWLRPWRSLVEARLRDGLRVVCPDLRTRDELLAARVLGGEVWLIERHGAGAPGPAGAHVTERGFDMAEVDEVVLNEMTVADLEARVRLLVDRQRTAIGVDWTRGI